MISIEFHMPEGKGSIIFHDVHPVTQENPIQVPPGAVSFTVWLDIVPVGMFRIPVGDRP